MVALPLLWLYGTSGVGKTTVAEKLYRRLTSDGVPAGYVDIDQIGMCYGPPTPHHWAPEPVDDPGRHRVKARTLNAMIANFQALGAGCLIVSGVTDAARGVPADLLPRADLTPCRLRADLSDLELRLAARGNPADDLAREAAYGEALDRARPTDACVDTTGLTVTEVVDRVRALTGWPGPTVSAAMSSVSQPPADPTPGPILWLCGPAGVGKSTVGWRVYQQVRRAGGNAAFVDLDQIGFLHPAPAGDPGNHVLKAANLAAVWNSFHTTGAGCLIVVGPVDRPRDVMTYTAALPAATITLCRLTASPSVLLDRIACRGRGLAPTWGLAGDQLIGQPTARLREIADRSARIVEALDGVGDFAVNTDDRPAADIAAEIPGYARTASPSANGAV